MEILLVQGLYMGGGGGGGYGNDQNLHSSGANGVTTALNPGSFQLPPTWGFVRFMSQDVRT